MLFFKRALCGLACALWMVGAAHAVDARLVDAVRSTMRSPGELYTYSGGPEVYGGTPLVVNDNGYYWIKGGQVYAVNGVAMGMSPDIRKAPPSVGFALIDKAIESGKAVPLPANLGIDMWNFPEAVNAILQKSPLLKKGNTRLQLKKSTVFSWEATEKGNTVAALNFEEKGGMVTSAHVSFRLQKGSQSTTVFLATMAALDPELMSKKEDAPEALAIQSFFDNMMKDAGKEATVKIGRLTYKGVGTQKHYIDVYISPQAQ